MKTKQFIILVLLLLSGLIAAADTPQRSLSFFARNGIVLMMPVMEEDVVDSVPSEITHAFDAYRVERHRSLLEHTFDLSGLVMPEPDADDVVIDTASVFQQITGCYSAKK